MADWTPGVPQFKPERVSKKVTRFIQRSERKLAEDKNKGKVRKRDKYCRFPLCGCKKFRLALHVSHKVHKGIGGNPAGDRSVPELMVYVCAARHRENPVSIDRGSLRWEPLTEEGANGPIAWHVRARPGLITGPQLEWFLVAVETAPHVYEAFSPAQRSVLTRLAEMTL